MQSPPEIASPDNLIHVANGVTGLVALAAFAGLLQPILGCIASLFAIAWFGVQIWAKLDARARDLDVPDQ